ncbi:retrovirus-related pol polyprotein from transposon TNT 1-94, partial [Tanacetum coccineum]
TNTETSIPNIEPSVPEVTQSQITQHASTSSHPAPQDIWSRDQHIEFVHIIGEPNEGMITRSMVAKLIAASASECLFVSKNKKDELGTVIGNKARLVAQGFSQEEGIDYDETFAPMGMMEAFRIFLAYTTYMNFIVFHMNVKSACGNKRIVISSDCLDLISGINNNIEHNICIAELT